MAAVTRTVLSLVDVSFEADKIANVVAMEVDASDTPAAKAVKLHGSVGVNKGRRKDNPMGKTIPISAMIKD